MAMELALLLRPGVGSSARSGSDLAFSVLVAFIIFGIFFFQIRERFDTLDLQYLESFRGERR